MKSTSRRSSCRRGALWFSIIYIYFSDSLENMMPKFLSISKLVWIVFLQQVLHVEFRFDSVSFAKDLRGSFFFNLKRNRRYFFICDRGIVFLQIFSFIMIKIHVDLQYISFSLKNTSLILRYSVLEININETTCCIYLTWFQCWMVMFRHQTYNRPSPCVHFFLSISNNSDLDFG